MKMHARGNAAVWVLVIGALGIGSFAWYFLQNSQSSPTEQEEATVHDDIVIEKTGEFVGYEGKLLAGQTSPIFEFTQSDYEKAIQTDKLIVLYFYATWCPLCRAEQPALMAAFNERTDDSIIGFRVNYNDSDTDSDEVALARKYGVAYQHTKVFIKNGEQVLKSPESWDTDRYILEINRALQ